MDLTNEQWSLIEPLIPVGRSGKGKKGRPRRDDRQILNGILWVLRTGAPWRVLPPEYPSRSTCHRRLQQWVRDKTFAKILGALADELEIRGGLNLQETFIDGSFAAAQKGGSASGQPKKAKAPR
jgi:transposase